MPLFLNAIECRFIRCNALPGLSERYCQKLCIGNRRILAKLTSLGSGMSLNAPDKILALPVRERIAKARGCNGAWGSSLVDSDSMCARSAGAIGTIIAT